MIIKAAKRTESVREYYFSMKLKEIARINAERLAIGDEPVINLGIGSPDGMPPTERQMPCAKVHVSLATMRIRAI